MLALYMKPTKQGHFDEWTGTPELLLRGFGPGRVELRGCTLTSSDWTYRKARELLFYLASNPPKTKEQIGVALWPDVSEAQLHDQFRITLHHLRRALGSPDWVLYQDEVYVFNRGLPYWFDVEAFEFHLSVAQLAVERPDQGTLPAGDYFDRAISLYSGDFLEHTEAEWCGLRREELLRMYLEALLAWGKLLVDAGECTHAAEIYRCAIAKDGYLEAAHRGLMRCLARQGELGQALRQYQSLAELLRTELNAGPAPETLALHERLRRGEPI